MMYISDAIFATIQDILNGLNLPLTGPDKRIFLECFEEVYIHKTHRGDNMCFCTIETDDIPMLVEKTVAVLSGKGITEIPGIKETIVDVFSSYLSKKPFSFLSSIYFDDDHYTQWYAELHPSNFLIEKIEKILCIKKPNYILHKDPPPEFYATYDLIKGSVSVLGRCSIENHPKRFTETFPVFLTSREADLLIFCIENLCRDLHNGKDCLTILNEERQRVGMDILKCAIAGKVCSVQNH